MKMLVRVAIESGSAADFEARAGEAQDVAEEYALGPIVLARIDDCTDGMRIVPTIAK